MSRKGQALIEFTLIGIPILFTIISIFEMSRGMWIYHTLNYSVKRGARLAVVHGINCQNTANNPNNCPVTVGDVAREIQQNGAGLDPNTTTLTFTPVASGTPCALQACLALTEIWPTYDSSGVTSDNAVGKPIRIRAVTIFRSALGMLFPGVGTVRFGVYNLGADSTEYVQF